MNYHHNLEIGNHELKHNHKYISNPLLQKHLQEVVRYFEADGNL